jgi:hypothetical protein
MKAFAALYAALDASSSTRHKVAVMSDYLRTAPPADAAWAVYFLAGGKPRQTVPSRVLREAACEAAGLAPWLFEESYAAVGDLAETIAHLLPDGAATDDTGLAQWLQTRPEVAQVLHPALPSHPGHALWRRDFTGSSGLFSFELRPGMADTPAALAALVERRRFYRIGYSWGGYESLIMPARLNGVRSVQPWNGGPLIRLHVGLEDTQDLIDDLDAGLAAMRAAG